MPRAEGTPESEWREIDENALTFNELMYSTSPVVYSTPGRYSDQFPPVPVEDELSPATLKRVRDLGSIILHYAEYRILTLAVIQRREVVEESKKAGKPKKLKIELRGVEEVYARRMGYKRTS